MKIDLDYLKNLLEILEASPTAVFDIDYLEKAGFDLEDDQFIFHMNILTDRNLLARDDWKPGYGLSRGSDGHIAYSAVPLRLTADGHQFIEAIRNKEVLAVLKKGFGDASLNTILDVSKRLFEGFLTKKLEAILV